MLPNEDEIVAQYAPLVRRLALQLATRLPANVELDDLMQAGMMGLLDAARKYEAQADAKFETYASTRIRGAMLDELRSQDWLPRSVRTKARELEAAIFRVEQRIMGPATEQAIAEELGVTLDEYYRLLDDTSGAQVLHYEDLAKMAGQQEVVLDVAHDGESPQHVDNPLNLLMSRDLHEAIVAAIEALPEREKLLLSLQFEHDLNQKEIAAVMGVSEGRVSQLRSQAVARMRAKLAVAL